jgi:hypothetical protein
MPHREKKTTLVTNATGLALQKKRGKRLGTVGGASS